MRLPVGAVFVIDAKCSLNAFLDAQDATDDAIREACYVRHAQSVRSHMIGLSGKTYWDQFSQGSPASPATVSWPRPWTACPN